MMTHLGELVLRLGLGHLGFAILLPNSPEGSKGPVKGCLLVHIHHLIHIDNHLILSTTTDHSDNT